MKQFTNLGLKDRKRIEILLAKNLLVGVIAKQLGFHRSTIAREIHRNSPQGNSYSANFAEKRMKKRQRKKKEGKRKLDLNLNLKKYIFEKIEDCHSPNQIVESLKKLYPKDMSMHVSEETIYQYIYVLGRGELKKTLIYDQGKEMVQHKRFTIDTNMQVYFADPRSPWQRGTNENTNGLLRQFFPKGTDFNQITSKEIRRVENLLNNRPRKSLGYFTPNEVYFKLLH